MLPATATQSITVHGNVGQLAGRDITNLVMIIDQAEAHLEASDCTPEQREQARSRLRTLRNAVQTGGVDVASKTLAELMLRFAGLP